MKHFSIFLFDLFILLVDSGFFFVSIFTHPTVVDFRKEQRHALPINFI
jgi:hypothetical protein